jgi:hypothetical protein
VLIVMELNKAVTTSHGPLLVLQAMIHQAKTRTASLTLVMT